MVSRRALVRALGLSVLTTIAGCDALPGTDSTDPSARDPTSTETATPTSVATLSPTGTPGPEPSTDTETSSPSITDVVGTPGFTHDRDGVTEFGRAVALSGEVAVVIAAGHGAYAFTAGEEWSGPAELTPDDAEDFGGHDVSGALVGNVAVIGGPSAGPDSDRGAVYLFERADGNWVQRHRFTPDREEDGDQDEVGDEFGRSIAYDGDRVVVGDVHDPGMEVPWTGGAYVFEGGGTDWTQEAAIGTDASDLFGTSVAVDGDEVLVGAPYVQPEDVTTGGVYVYERTGNDWHRRTVLAPSDLERGSLFGHSVAMDGDTAVIGAPGSQAGSAYVFDQTGGNWVRQARLTTADAGKDARVGHSVTYDGGIAVVGAPEAHDTGRAYAFSASDTWQRPLRLAAEDPPADVEFGFAVGLSDATVLVGAPLFDGASEAYLFEL